MRLLFAISVASFCTVLWLALSLARRIRRDRVVGQQPAPRPAATEFFEAGEFRTPRPLRHNQEISQLTKRRGLEAVLGQPHPSVTQPAPRMQRRPMPQPNPQPVAANTSPQFEAVVVDSMLQFVMPALSPTPETLPHRTPPLDISGERKSPKPARSGSFRRVDLSHYNNDMGDLTDPYTHSPRGAGVRPGMAKNA